MAYEYETPIKKQVNNVWELIGSLKWPNFPGPPGMNGKMGAYRVVVNGTPQQMIAQHEIALTLESSLPTDAKYGKQVMLYPSGEIWQFSGNPLTWNLIVANNWVGVQ